MTELISTAPVDDSPGIEIPRELINRMVINGSSRAEFQIVLLIATIKTEGDSAFGPVSDQALATHPLVVDAGQMEGTPIASEGWPWDAVEAAAVRGSILRFNASSGSDTRTWSVLNTVRNAIAVARLTSGQDKIPEQYWLDQDVPRIAVERPTNFRLYEQNIGPLTPIIAQRLIKAMEMYPNEWIAGAIEEAVAYNRRNWRYISRILENWAQDGPTRRT